MMELYKRKINRSFEGIPIDLWVRDLDTGEFLFPALAGGVDNTTLDAGSGGDTIASDDIAGVKYQRVKLVEGADGTNDGDISSANPLPVDVSDSSTRDLGIATVDNAGTFVVQEDGAALTALQLIDDPVATDDTTTHTAASTKVMGIGAVAAPTDTTVEANDIAMPAMSTDRRLHTDTQIVGQDADVTIADGGNSITVDNAGTFATQVDGAALTALQLIDNVVHVDDAAFTLGTSSGVMMMGFAGTQTVDANDAAALACDSDGALHVSDGGNTLTVDGTVTANLSATDNTVLDNIDTNTTGLAGCVGGTELQVDVVGALPAGTNAIGKLAANSGVDIGDVDVLSIAAGSNLVGDVGISGARTSGGTTLYKNIDVDESEDQVKGTAGQVYWIHAMNLSAAVLYLKFYNATAATVVVGTTVPDLTFALATQGDTNGAGFTLCIPNGIAFGTAITIACTTGIADNDSGAPAANACSVMLGYA